MTNTKTNVNQLAANIDEAYEEMFKSDKYARDVLLKELGYDPEKVMGRGLEFVKRLENRMSLASASSKRAKFDNLRQKYAQLFSTSVGEQLKIQFQNSFVSGFDQATVQACFRDLQNIEDAEIQSMLQDKAMLDELKALFEIE